MRIRTIFAFGAGYVLGAKAGRGRYQQLVRWFENIAATSAGRAVTPRSKQLMGSTVSAARHAAASGLSTASDRVRKLADQATRA